MWYHYNIAPKHRIGSRDEFLVSLVVMLAELKLEQFRLCAPFLASPPKRPEAIKNKRRERKDGSL